MNIQISHNVYRLDHDNEILWRGNMQLQIRPKLFALLNYLVKNPNRLISHQELLDNIWPNVYVSPEIIKSSIRDLRRLLNDDPAKPCFIQTKHGRGYRFIGSIETDIPEQEQQYPATDAVYYF